MKILVLDLLRNSGGGVMAVEWRAEKTSKGYRSTCDGSEKFTPDPTNPDYVVYTELTEPIVRGWVLERLASQLDRIEAALDKDINDKVSPQFYRGVPWRGKQCQI